MILLFTVYSTCVLLLGPEPQVWAIIFPGATFLSRLPVPWGSQVPLAGSWREPSRLLHSFLCAVLCLSSFSTVSGLPSTPFQFPEIHLFPSIHQVVTLQTSQLQVLKRPCFSAGLHHVIFHESLCLYLMSLRTHISLSQGKKESAVFLLGDVIYDAIFLSLFTTPTHSGDITYLQMRGSLGAPAVEFYNFGCKLFLYVLLRSCVPLSSILTFVKVQ